MKKTPSNITLPVTFISLLPLSIDTPQTCSECPSCCFWITIDVYACVSIEIYSFIRLCLKYGRSEFAKKKNSDNTKLKVTYNCFSFFPILLLLGLIKNAEIELHKFERSIILSYAKNYTISEQRDIWNVRGTNKEHCLRVRLLEGFDLKLFISLLPIIYESFGLNLTEYSTSFINI